MRKLRVLALMHDYLVPPTDVTGIDVSTAKWKMEYDVTHTLEQMGHEVRALGLGGDLGVITEAVEELEPAHRLQPDGELRGHRDLRPERRQPPRAAARALHRLQPARPDARARQGAVEDAARLPPHPGARVRGLPRRPRRAAAQAAEVPGHREVADPGVVDRHLAGVGGRGRGQAARARPLHPPQGRHRRHRRALHRRAASSTSA